MGPLGIYITIMIAVLMLGIAIRLLVRLVTRTCHECGAKVEVGRQRCQICGYRFDESRW
jgi:tRNA(Ile2) C34 agmatinyltransferase TiaS